jgi:hypothetical protein
MTTSKTKKGRHHDISKWFVEMAEREGFEPPIPVKVCPLSRRIVSTTHAPLRVGQTPSSELSVVGNNRWLPAISKERLQHFRAASCQYAVPNLNLMIQLRVIQHLHH